MNAPTPADVLLESRAIKDYLEDRSNRLRVEISWLNSHVKAPPGSLRRWLNGEGGEITQQHVTDILSLLGVKTEIVFHDIPVAELSEEQKEALAELKKTYGKD